VELSQVPIRAQTVIRLVTLATQLGNVGDWITTLIGAGRPWWVEQPGMMRQAIATWGPLIGPTVVKTGAVVVVACMAWVAMWAAGHRAVTWIGMAVLIALLGLYTWLAVFLNAAVLVGHP